MRTSTWTPTEAVLILFKQIVDIVPVYLVKKSFLFDDTVGWKHYKIPV
jgi:hypothetical protein